MGIAEMHRSETGYSGDLEQGNSRLRVGSSNLGRVLAVVRENDGDLARFFNDGGRRDDVTFGRKNHARSLAGSYLRALSAGLGSIRWFEFDQDSDNAWRDVIDNIPELRVLLSSAR